MGLLSSNWEFGQTPWGSFLGVDVEGGTPWGVGLAKEERSLLIRKPLCAVWANLKTVSFLDIKVGSGATLDKDPLSSTLTVILPERGGVPARVSQSLREQPDPQVPLRDWLHVHTCLCCLASGTFLALFHPLPPPSPHSLATDTLTVPFVSPARSLGGCTVGPVSQLLGHLTQEVRVALALCQRHF